jgi:hypothetical protein
LIFLSFLSPFIYTLSGGPSGLNLWH